MNLESTMPFDDDIAAPGRVRTGAAPGASQVAGARGLTASVALTDDAVAALRPDWMALAQTVRPATLGQHPDTWRAWSRSGGASIVGRDAPVLAWRDGDGRLAGVLPLMRRGAWRGPTLGVRYDYDPADARYLTTPPRRVWRVRQLSPALSLAASQTGPMLLAHRSDRPRVLGSLAADLAAIGGWDVFVAPVDAAEAEAWRAALAPLLARIQPLDRPALRLVPACPAADLIARQSKKMRQNVRRAEVAAGREGLTLHRTGNLAGALPHLRRLAAASWKARGRDGEAAVVPYHGAQAAFFESYLGGDTLPRGVVVTARLGDDPVAILVAASQGGTVTPLLTFWDGRVPAASPGLLVILSLIDWAAAEGAERIDYNSNSPWLRHLADERSTEHNILAFAPTWRGRWLARLSAAAQRRADRRGAGDGAAAPPADEDGDGRAEV